MNGKSPVLKNSDKMKRLLGIAMITLTVSSFASNSYKDAYGTTWYMRAIDSPEWDDGALVGWPVTNDGTAYVYKLNLPGSLFTTLTIPTRIPWSSGGEAPDAHPEIKYLTIDATDNHPYIEVVVVNESTALKNPCFRNCGALKEFQLANYGSRDTGIVKGSEHAIKGGVLYNGDFTDLKKYPEGKAGDTFVVPASVEKVHQFTLANTQLKRIVFEGDAPKILRAYDGDLWTTVSNTVVYGSEDLSLICYSQGASGWGKTWCGIKTAMVLDAVTGVTASSGTQSSGVSLSWKANSSASSYNIYRTDGNGRSLIKNVGRYATTYLDVTAIPLVKYTYEVIAVASDVEGKAGVAAEGWAAEPTFEFSTQDGEATLVSCVCAGGTLTIPAEYENCPVTVIGNSALRGQAGVSEIVIPEYVTRIEASAFAYCEGLETITIPCGVESIGASVFRYCSQLTTVVLPDTLVELGESAFESCHQLANVNIPTGITSIRPCTFYYCESLPKIVIPPAVTNIGSAAFYFCSLLSEVNIPQAVRTIGAGAFYGCTALGDGVVYKSGWLLTVNNGGDLESVVVQKGTVGIAGEAFGSCWGLTNVVLPNTLRTIGDSAFSSKQVTELVIPAGVTEIGDNAFGWCWSLTNVTFLGNAPVVGEEPFIYSENCVVYVKAWTSGWGVDIPGTWNGCRIEYAPGCTDPIPDIGDEPTSEEVAEALSGSADERLTECITNAADYKAYREWAASVMNTAGSVAAGAQAVRESPNAWLSFALGSKKLIAVAPTNGQVTVEAFEPTGEDGKFDFTVGIDEVEIDSSAAKENLKRVFGLEGGAALEGMSSTNVDISFGTPQNGKVKFTAGPKDVEAKTFFMKVRLNQ